MTPEARFIIFNFLHLLTCVYIVCATFSLFPPLGFKGRGRIWEQKYIRNAALEAEGKGRYFPSNPLERVLPC
jgi:hypothetical protein